MKYWTIAVEDAKQQIHTFALQSKGDCYVSANTKFVGIDKAVCVSTEDLATRFRDAMLPAMKRRHGAEVVLQVASLTRKRQHDDDALVSARISTGNFAPNKKPIGV